MENLKIRVNGEVENKEVQGIFKILGGAWGEHVKADHYDKEFLYLTNGVIEYDDLLSEFLAVDECKEITLPELRDMVVLKRNDIEDANAFRHDSGVKYYITSDNKYYYFSNLLTFEWTESCNDIDYLKKHVKPIEKTEMKAKEYLNKETHAYVKTHDLVSKDSNWIEIPEWAVAYADHKNGHGFFYDSFCKIASFYNIAWSRHTIPEELPFIDDDFKLNIPEELKGRADLLSGRIIIDDEPLKVIDSEYSKDGNSVTHTVLLNDQYAEIETVRQSAWQKQEGGNHYKNLKIQPMQYALENKLDYAQANVVKYVTRHKEKNGKEDLLKAIHNIELMIEFYYGGGE